MNHKFVLFAKLMNTYLNHFPKHEKYALAQQIRNAAYDVYGLIQEGEKRYLKKTTLSNLDIRHEQLRMYINLAHELGYFRFKDGRAADESAEDVAIHRYLVISRAVDELGRLIGGWIVSQRKTLAVREAS